MTKAEVEEARQSGRLLGEKPIGFILAPKAGQAKVPGEALQPASEPSKVTITRSGIETPRGPLTRAIPAQQELFKPQIRQSPGMGL